MNAIVTCYSPRTCHDITVDITLLANAKIYISPIAGEE